MKNNEIYNKVAQRIIEELENGIIPWQQPWFGTVSGPFSRSTGKPYSFINQILLGKPGEYLTFNQIKEDGKALFGCEYYSKDALEFEYDITL